MKKVLIGGLLGVIVVLGVWLMIERGRRERLLEQYANLTLKYENERKEIAVLSSEIEKVSKELSKAKEQVAFWKRKAWVKEKGKVVEVVREVPADCEECVRNFVRPITVQGEGWIYTDENCLDDEAGELVLTEDFKEKILEACVKGVERLKEPFLSFRGGLAVDIFEGVGFSLEILNFKRLIKLPLGAGIQVMYDVDEAEESRVGMNLHFRVLRNVAVGGFYSVRFDGVLMGGGLVEVYLW